jgi:hypothetical protein
MYIIKATRARQNKQANEETSNYRKSLQHKNPEPEYSKAKDTQDISVKRA